MEMPKFRTPGQGTGTVRHRYINFILKRRKHITSLYEEDFTREQNKFTENKTDIQSRKIENG